MNKHVKTSTSATIDGRAVVDMRLKVARCSLNRRMKKLDGVLWVLLACLPLLQVSICLRL